MTASYVGSSVLVFWYAVCLHLHQQQEEFCNGFCFKHFNSKRCFDSFFGKFNAITGNLDKFLKREKGFILDFRLGSEYPYAESFIFRSIRPDVWWPIVANFNLNHWRYFKPHLNFIFEMKIKSKFIFQIDIGNQIDLSIYLHFVFHLLS